MALILLIAAVLRLTGIDWDRYQHHHPDERYITRVASTIEWPSSIRTALSPTQSTANPFYWPPQARSEGIVVLQDERRDFAYGHFPLYLGVAATRMVERIGPSLREWFPDDWLLTQELLNQAGLIEYHHLTAVVRALTALVDIGTVWLVYLLGRRLFNSAVGLLAAAFLALNVMHIQLAHFFAVDPYQTFFVVAAIYFMVLSYGSQRQRLNIVYWFLAAIMIGLAVGSKFSAILLFLPLLLTAFINPGSRRWRLGTAVLVSFVTFFITNPFALLDFGCLFKTPEMPIGSITVPSLNLGSCYLENVVTQGAMVRGVTDIAFARQYTGTVPYLYYIEMQLRWGMGLLLGIVAFAGFFWVVWRAMQPIWAWLWHVPFKEWHTQARQTLTNLQSPIPNLSIYIPLAWAIPFFITTGNFQVKFMRYLQPLTPFLMIFGAAMLLEWKSRIGRRAAVTAVLLVTGLYALSFVNIYNQPHPWISASEWVYKHVEPDTLILSEQWDDALPASMVVDGRRRTRQEYVNAELTWLTYADERDDVTRLQVNLNLLAAAEYLAVMSNRVYGVVPRLDGRYPLSSQYHQLLFDGALGYEPVFIADRSPNLAGFHLRPDTFGWPGLQPPAAVTAYLTAVPGINGGRADESFTVYDQPLTIIFKNTGHKTAVEMQALFNLNPES